MKIYPCLWFDQNGAEAADFYCSVFQQGAILQSNPMVTTFTIGGTKFMALNGGPKYRINSAISFFVYAGSDEEITRLYNVLKEDGKVVMPLGKYDWTSKYAWIQDRFGVNWQLDIDPINNAQTIVPALLFSNDKKDRVKNAMMHYQRIFPNSRILLESPYPPAPGNPEGALLFAQFKLGPFVVNAMSSPLPYHDDFTPGISFVVECETQDEIDHYWNQLGEGGRFDMCGWLADQFGVSWQIVPAILPQLMSDPVKGHAVVAAFLKMQKFDLPTLLAI